MADLDGGDLRQRPRPGNDDPDRVIALNVWRNEDARWFDVVDEVAVEEPLQLRVDGRDLAVIMRTPGHDDLLAAGFLYAEGLLECPEDLDAIDLGSDRDGFPQRNTLDIYLRCSPTDNGGLRGRPRQFPVSSSCGLCGATSIEAVRQVVRPVGQVELRDPAILGDLERKLREAQAVFSRTGGLHAAGLFDVAGDLLTVHEDVGRHNAVDKVVGEMFLKGELPLDHHVLLVSGRASFELIQKAARAGIAIFAAIGAPSSLAVELAQAVGITLVGLLRSTRWVVYSHPHRVGYVESDHHHP